MPFVRSFPICQDGPVRQVREHTNNITAYVDGSMIYGSTFSKFNRLRVSEAEAIALGGLENSKSLL